MGFVIWFIMVIIGIGLYIDYCADSKKGKGRLYYDIYKSKQQ